MREILVSWSTAYDTHMHFEWSFGEEFERQGQNMSLTSRNYEKNHWWTWANIAYNLALLWENPILLTSVWEDYSFSWIMDDKVNLKHIHKDMSLPTANSVIVSDKEDNRMTFFHPWAMDVSNLSRVEYVREDIGIAIVAANDPQTMLEHSRQLKKRWVKFFADPAQQITSLSKEDLKELLDISDYLILNIYELDELIEKVDTSIDVLAVKYEIFIITKGSDGLDLYLNGNKSHIDSVKIENDNIIDTTWAGDALRAWVLFSYMEWIDIKNGCELGTIMASYCIQAPWSQYHHFNLWQLEEDLKLHFDTSIGLYNRRKY